MSKPDKPGELRNVEVSAISMVSKAANGERFKIFKSADEEPEQVKPETSEVEKGAVSDTYNAGKNSEKLNEAFNALRKVLKLGNKYENPNTPPETDANKIREALDDFRSVAGQILLGTEPEAIVKTGRKISGSRLSRLKEIQNIINEVLDDVEEETVETNIAAPNSTENAGIQKAIKEALKPIADKVNGLNVEAVVKEALTPIITRIEKIEKARGFSNRALESTQVVKNDGSFWDGAF